KLPQGFLTAGISAGLKRSGKRDLGLILAAEPLNWAFVSTRNVVRAACVDRNRQLFESGAPVQALVINSGNANCATGEQGVVDNQAMATATAGHAGISVDQVLTSSTGVVGQRMPLDAITAALPELQDSLGDDSAAFA